MLTKLVFVAFAAFSEPSSFDSTRSSKLLASHFTASTSLPDYEKEHEMLLANVNEVNHGEIENCVEKLLEYSQKSDAMGVRKVPIVAVQSCIGGGKSFMTSAVAAALTKRVPSGTLVVKISLADGADPQHFLEGEDVFYTAVLPRIAFELAGRPTGHLAWEYYDFDESVHEFLGLKSKVILLIEDLNAIPVDAPRYERLYLQLSSIAAREGNALMYTTDNRETEELLKGAHLPFDIPFGQRSHFFFSIPRFQSQQCVHGILKNPTVSRTFWSAVTRGRIPALFLLEPSAIQQYHVGMPELEGDLRRHVLKAAITGIADNLPKYRRDSIRAFSFMADIKSSSDKELYCWPPFLLAKKEILGKSFSRLSRALEDPSISEANAYKALCQLSVLIRLLSNQSHPLVPISKQVDDDNSLSATEMYYASDKARTIDEVRAEVKRFFSKHPRVFQVLVTPLSEEFGTYDFLVLHRQGSRRKRWVVKAGYQCTKEWTAQTTKRADRSVPLSVWIQADASKRLTPGDDGDYGKTVYRTRSIVRLLSDGDYEETLFPSDGSVVRVVVLRTGFKLPDSKTQAELLGVSIAQSLPPLKVNGDRCCSAAKSLGGDNK